MNIIQKLHIPAQSGVAFKLTVNQIVRIIDPEGGQVADLVAFNQKDFKEKSSTGVTLDNNMSLFIKKGDSLFSNKYHKIFTIIEDTVGKHDILYPACSPDMYRFQYNIREFHPSCYENLTSNLKKFNIDEELPIPFNIFQNSHVSSDGKLKIKAPISKAGDYIDIKAEMDLIVAISACSVKESACNNFKCSPINVEIYQV
jgi:uncharacterized protein YcgI (DUF1989 family)